MSEKTQKPIVTNLAELRDLMLLCKVEKVKSLKMQGVEIEFSELSYIDATDPMDTFKPNVSKHNSETLVDTMENNNSNLDDPDLFWSTDK